MRRHRAFAVSASGAYAWHTAGGTIAEATVKSLRQCADVGRPRDLDAIDDRYVTRRR